jgi:Flp pilus assembly protein TadB
MTVGLAVAGPLGVAAGAAFGLLLARWISRLEPAAVMRARERLIGDLPMAADLLGACCAVGRSPEQALLVVGRAVGGPLGGRFDEVTARLALGGDPLAEWEKLSAHPELGPLGRVLRRCAETGAPLADSLFLLAIDRRRDLRLQRQTKARNVGVRAAGPLALCFLPAFMLIGVVPTVAGAFQHLFA